MPDGLRSAFITLAGTCAAILAVLAAVALHQIAYHRPLPGGTLGVVMYSTFFGTMAALHALKPRSGRG